MYQICDELLAYTRGCERLLSYGSTLTEEERSLLEYYIKELSCRFMLNMASVPAAKDAAIRRPLGT